MNDCSCGEYDLGDAACVIEGDTVHMRHLCDRFGHA